MGYYTDYTLNIFSAVRDLSGKIIGMEDGISPIMQQQIEAEIEKMNIFSDGNVLDSYYVNAKWYDCEDDMRLLSAKFPDIVFWLNGEGEGSDDLWQRFFVEGKIQECYAKIIYDDFDASKLKGEPIKDISQRKYSYQIE